MTARRTGVIHAWDDDAPADFAIDRPVPVYVRDPLTREVLGRGSVVAGRLEGGDLWADIDWPEDIEALAGKSTPSARCKFDDSGRLVRVVVELEDSPAMDADPGEYADPSTDPDNDLQPTGDRQAAMAGDPSAHINRRQAEMAANDRQQNEDAANHTQAEMAGYDDAGNPINERSPAEIAAELARVQKALAENNRKAKADRLKLEEFEKAAREAEEAKLGEGDRVKRERDQQNQARMAAESSAKALRDEYERFKVDVEIERMALTAGFKYPVMVPKLIDRELIDYDEDTGKPLNLKDVLKRLADTYPDLMSPAPGRPGTPPRTGPMPRNGQNEPARNEPISIIEDLRRKVHYPGR